eukprot:1042816-Rhodomonas_salina.1
MEVCVCVSTRRAMASAPEEAHDGLAPEEGADHGHDGDQDRGSELGLRLLDHTAPELVRALPCSSGPAHVSTGHGVWQPSEASPGSCTNSSPSSVVLSYNDTTWKLALQSEPEPASGPAPAQQIRVKRERKLHQPIPSESVRELSGCASGPPTLPAWW